MDRFGVFISHSPSSNAEEEAREERRKWPFAFSPVQKMQRTAILAQQDHTGSALSPAELVAPWDWVSHSSRQAEVNREQCHLSVRKLALKRDQPVSQVWDKDICSRRGRNPASSSRRTCRKDSKDDGQFLQPSQSRSRSPPLSLVREERSTSLERTRQHFFQISHSACEEGAALERLLALEVSPVAQKLFDAAVAQYAKACRLLEVDHIGGLTSLDNAQWDERSSRRSLSHDPVKNINIVEGTSTSANVDQNASVASSDTAASLNASTNSSEAWRRAVRAGVITVSSPSALSPRPSLPARKLDTLFDGGECESPRWSIGGRSGPRRREECDDELIEAPEAMLEEEREKEEPVEGLSARTSVCEGVNNMAFVSGTRGNESGGGRVALEDFFNNFEDDEEEDGILNFSRQVAAEISSKIVGLSSRIRQKAAEASQGRRK